MISRKLSFENPWILCAAVVALNAWIILPTGFSSLMFADQAQSIYHARELMIGRVPYRDIFNHHFTGYLLGFWIVEFLIGITPAVFWCLAVIWNVVNAAIVYWYFSRLGGRRLASLMALVVSTAGWFLGFYGATFNNQSYLQPLTYAYIATIFVGLGNPRQKPAFIVSGLLAGTMCVLDQRLVPYSLALLLLLFRDGVPSFVNVLRTAFSFAVVPTIGGLYLYIFAATDEFVRQTLLFPLIYRTADALSLEEWFELVRFFAKRQAIPLTLGVIGIALLLLKSPRHLLKGSALLFLLIGAWAVLAGARPYPHYGMSIAPIIVFGIGFAVHYSHGLVHRAILCILITSSAFVPLNSLLRTCWGFPFFHEGEQPSAIRQVGEYLLRHYRGSRDILVWGYAPQIYNLSNTFSSFRDVSLMAITGTNFDETNSAAQAVNPEYVEEFKTYLRNSPPHVVVVFEMIAKGEGTPRTNRRVVGLTFRNMDYKQVPALEFFKVELESSYTLVETFVGPYDRTLVYRRSPLPSSAFLH